MADAVSWSALLDSLRNVSHDDLDDRYAGKCDCGGALSYARTDEFGHPIPRGLRPVVCASSTCDQPTTLEAIDG